MKKKKKTAWKSQDIFSFMYTQLHGVQLSDEVKFPNILRSFAAQQERTQGQALFIFCITGF